MENINSFELLLHKTVSPDVYVCKLLVSIGIMPNTRGYYFFKEAVLISAYRTEIFLKKRIYSIIATLFNETYSKVERNMRHSITCAYNRGLMINLNKFVGIDVVNENAHLTNYELISLIAELLTCLYSTNELYKSLQNEKIVF